MLVTINPNEFAVRCDVPGCDLEIPAPTEEEALDAAACAGFKFEKGVAPPAQRHACPDCQRGVSAAAQAAKAAHAAQASLAAKPTGVSGTGNDSDPTGWLN